MIIISFKMEMWSWEQWRSRCNPLGKSLHPQPTGTLPLIITLLHTNHLLDSKQLVLDCFRIRFFLSEVKKENIPLFSPLQTNGPVGVGKWKMGEEESEDEWEMVGNEEEEKKEERKAKMRTNDMSRSRRWGRVERGRGGNYWNVSVKRRNLPLVALGGDINILPPETPTCLPHPLWSPPFPTLNPQPSYLKGFFWMHVVMSMSQTSQLI